VNTQPKSSLRIIDNAKNTITTAELGLNDFKNSPTERKLHGLTNVIVFGRSVTNVLQQLRSTESGFDNWYNKYVEEMRSDPLMKYFYDLRSKILKEGETSISTSVHVGHFNISEIDNYPRPENATAFFIGDQRGGSGWEIKLLDGTTEKYYVTLENDSISISFEFRDLPKIHLGNDISKKNISELCELYIDYLKKLIKSAEKKFCSHINS